MRRPVIWQRFWKFLGLAPVAKPGEPIPPPTAPEPAEVVDQEAMEREAMDRIWPRVERKLRESPPPDIPA